MHEVDGDSWHGELRPVTRPSDVQLRAPDGAWRKVVALALLGGAISTLLCLWNLTTTEATLGHLVTAAPTRPAAPVIAEDLPDFPLSEAGEHDGQQFYAIARELPSLDAAATRLDRSHYRLQRILFPAVARLIHPGRGEGLVWTMFALGIAGVVALGAAAGMISRALHGPAWPAAAVAALPGCFISLRITVPDPVALAFTMWAVYLSLRARHRAATGLGVLGVLTRESSLSVLLGVALWRRDRAGLQLVAVPLAVAAGWWLTLKVTVTQQGAGVIEFVPPLTGWVDALEFWRSGLEPAGAGFALLGLALGVAALVRRGVGHPLGAAIAVQLALLVVLSSSALAPERNASRSTLPLATLAIVALAAPDPRSRTRAPAAATA